MTFDVTIKARVDLEWDTGKPEDYGLTSPNASIYPYDGSLSLVGVLENNMGFEGNLIHDTLKDSSANINLYFLGGCSIHLGDSFFGTINAFLGNPQNGVARPDQNVIFIASDSFGNSEPSEIMTGYRLRTIAHEIGHCLFGPGHPHQDDGYGMAPLKGLLPENSVSERLMVTGSAIRKPNPGTRIVKGEWDMAEKWIQQQITEGKLPQ